MQFPSSYANTNPCFIAGKISDVGNCHAAWRHQKMTSCTSVVYGIEYLGSELYESMFCGNWDKTKLGSVNHVIVLHQNRTKKAREWIALASHAVRSWWNNLVPVLSHILTRTSYTPILPPVYSRRARSRCWVIMNARGSDVHENGQYSIDQLNELVDPLDPFLEVEVRVGFLSFFSVFP